MERKYKKWNGGMKEWKRQRKGCDLPFAKMYIIS